MVVCPVCGEENPEKFRLCGYCGTKLVPEDAPQAARKLVTIVFCDLIGSTALGERMDSEALHEIKGHYFEAMAQPRRMPGASTGRPVARSTRSAQVTLTNFSAEITLPVARSST